MYGSGVNQHHNVYGVISIIKHVGDDQLPELDVLDLVQYFSWKNKYIQTPIAYCKVTSLISDKLLIATFIILVSSPNIESFISIFSLVGPIAP